MRDIAGADEDSKKLLRPNAVNLLHISAHEMKPVIENITDNPTGHVHKWEDYYKFSTVRNPWKKMASYYFFLEPDKNFKIKFDPDEERDFDSIYHHHFNDFLKWLMDKGLGLPHYEFFCCDWDTKELLLDDVFKLEDIDNTFVPKFKEKTGIEFPTDVAIPDLLPDWKPEKSSAYTKYKGNYYDLYNEESINIVEEVYKSDIENFDYKFGD
jgi:hypothetical protein